MPNPVLIPLAFRALIALAAFAAGALGLGLAKVANASNRSESTDVPQQTGSTPLNNVATFEETAAQMREEVRKNPSLAEGMTPEHKRRLGITDDSLPR